VRLVCVRCLDVLSSRNHVHIFCQHARDYFVIERCLVFTLYSFGLRAIASATCFPLAPSAYYVCSVSMRVILTSVGNCRGQAPLLPFAFAHSGDTPNK